VNGDRSVNGYDLIAVLKAFGSRPGSPRWNPSADLNHNGIVDASDLYTVLRSFRDPTCR